MRVPTPPGGRAGVDCAAAQQAFVDALNKAGEPHGYSFERKDKRTKPSDATEIASVESATALQQAQHIRAGDSVVDVLAVAAGAGHPLRKSRRPYRRSSAQYSVR